MTLLQMMLLISKLASLYICEFKYYKVFFYISFDNIMISNSIIDYYTHTFICGQNWCVLHEHPLLLYYDLNCGKLKDYLSLCHRAKGLMLWYIECLPMLPKIILGWMTKTNRHIFCCWNSFQGWIANAERFLISPEGSWKVKYDWWASCLILFLIVENLHLWIFLHHNSRTKPWKLSIHSHPCVWNGFCFLFL